MLFQFVTNRRRMSATHAVVPRSAFGFRVVLAIL